MAAVAFPRQASKQHATLAPFQWQINGTTQHTMCCAALFITFFVFTVCLLRRYDSVTSCNPPPMKNAPPKSVDKEVLRRRLRGVLISQVRAFAHVFTCPMRVVTEWPLLLTSWPLHFPYYPSSTPYLLPSTSSTPSPSLACPADVSLSAAWQLQLVRVHMNKHRLHP